MANAKNKVVQDQPAGLPTYGMIVIGTISAVVVGLSFVVINYWPLPVSVAPYGGFREGALWGLVVGGVTGLVLGYCTDDTHFE